MTKKSPAKSPAKSASKAAPAKKPAASKATATKAASKDAPATSEKIAKAQIVELVSERTGLTKKEAGSALDAMLDAVTTALQGGKTVGLPGLGTFAVKATAARTGVRPGTSERIEIPAGKKVGFKVAADLKKSL